MLPWQTKPWLTALGPAPRLFACSISKIRNERKQAKAGNGAPRAERMEPRPQAATLWTAVLVATVFSTAAGLWVLCRPWEARFDWPALAALALLTVGLQSLAIDIYGRGRISASASALLAGGFLFGVPGALILAPLLPLTNRLRKGSMLHRSLFDAGDTTLSAVASVAMYQALAALLPGRAPALLLLPSAAAALSYYVVNVTLISIAIGVSENRSPLAVWKEKFRWLVAHYLAFGLLAFFIALGYQAIGMEGLAAFLIPPVMLRYVMKQYTDQTEENVVALKRVNGELVRAHDKVVSTLHELRTTYDATLTALSAALDSRDSETEGHSQRVVAYAEATAQQLGLSGQEMGDLLNGALLHDVGKIGVPDAILQKPGPLTAAEWEVMKQHPRLGYKMLEHIGFLSGALPVVRHHHERFDGTGYPDALKGEQIPQGARIFAVADAYDAMTSDRPYRRACTSEEARAEIARCGGVQFDPRVVEAFLRIEIAELARLSRPADDSEASTCGKGETPAKTCSAVSKVVTMPTFKAMRAVQAHLDNGEFSLPGRRT